jgi:O-antigen/teichoic acid export membrane protein
LATMTPNFEKEIVDPKVKDFLKFSSEGMFKRVLKGLGATLLGRVLTFISKILLVPLFIRMWGVDIYGEWLLLSSIVAYLSLTDLGGQLYIINRLTQAYSKNDIELFRKVLHSGLALFIILPLITLIIFSSVIYSVNIASIFQISKTDQSIASIVLVILAFQVVVFMPQGILLGIYRAVGLFPKGVMLVNLIDLLSIVFIALGLWIGGGMLCIAALQLLPYLIVILIALPELNRLFPQFRILSFENVELSLAKSFFIPSLHFLSIKFSQAIVIQGIILLVGAILGPVQVVVFATMRTIVFTIRQLLDMIVNTTWPEFTRLDAQQDYDKLLILFRIVMRSTLVLTAFTIVLLHFWGSDMYHFWLNKQIEFNQQLFDYFLIYVFQFIFWLLCQNVLMATNHHHTLSKVLFCTSLTSLALAYVFGLKFGINGVVIGMIVTDIILPFWIVPYLLYRFRQEFSLSFFLAELIPTTGAIVVSFFVPIASPIIFIALTWWWLRAFTRPRSVLTN